MKTFTVHVHKDNGRIDEVRFIEEGFSFWAFVFNIFWLIFHKLWMHATACVLVLIVINEMYLVGMFDFWIKMFLYFCVWVYIGLTGKDFLRWHYEREGWRLQDIIVAGSIDEAEYKYINSLIHKNAEAKEE